MKVGTKPVAEHRQQKRMTLSRPQEALVKIIRTTAHLRQSGLQLFEERGITPQQYNVLRILRGAGAAGLPTLDIAERMVERTPGITRLLDRLVAKKLVRRERPGSDRRQVFCHVTQTGLDVVDDLDAPLKKEAAELMGMLDEAELDQLCGLLNKVLGVK